MDHNSSSEQQRQRMSEALTPTTATTTARERVTLSEPQVCAAATRRHLRCTHRADRCRDGVWFCHVHDPLGTYQAQRAGRAQNLDTTFIRAAITAGEWSTAPEDEAAFAVWFLDTIRRKTGLAIPPAPAQLTMGWTPTSR